MIIKCNCNNCSTHIEFESGNEGEVVTCPACNLETTLYAPSSALPPPLPPKEIPQSLAKPIEKPTPQKTGSRDALAQVRSNSCYRTLRSLIGVVQGLWIALSLLFVVANIVMIITFGHNENGPRFTIVQLFYAIVAACLSIALAVAIKQAALLLVDIADCQIQALMRAKQERH
ncbi:MAG: hypothetical protein QM813_27705 [Verrucomicrobiota bacterium]